MMIQEHEEVTSFFSRVCFTVMTHLNLGNVFFFIWTKKENGKSKLIESFITFCNSFIEEVFHTQRNRKREREKARNPGISHTNSPSLFPGTRKNQSTSSNIALFFLISLSPPSLSVSFHALSSTSSSSLSSLSSPPRRHYGRKWKKTQIK